MPWPPVTRLVLWAVAAAAALLAFGYGPSRRTYVSPPRVTNVASAGAACELWRASGLHGRIALIFSRHLVPAPFGLTDTERVALGPDVEALESAMHHGVIREAYHVVPDGEWQATGRALSHVSIYRPSAMGLVAPFEDGRVNVLPLSRLWSMPEKTLVFLDPRIWSREELGQIARRIGSGAVTTDLVAVQDGTATDLELLSSAQAASAR